MATVTLTLKLDYPSAALDPDLVVGYVEDAVRGWKGGYAPEDERTLIDLVSIQVSPDTPKNN